MIALLCAFALAEEPVPVEGPAPPPAAEPAPPAEPVRYDIGDDQIEGEVVPAPIEVTVWGEAAIRDARARLVRDFEEQGWRAKDKGEQVVFKGPRVWMGKGHLDVESGAFTWTQPVVYLKAGKAGSVAPTLDPHEVSQGFSVQFGVPSKKKVRAKQDRVFAEINDSVKAYNDTIRETEFRTRLQELPDRLDALWTTGAPLEPGGPAAQTPEEKRKAILDYWAARADNPEGNAICHGIEAWVRATVQTSATPFTPAEAAAVTRAGAPFPLE